MEEINLSWDEVAPLVNGADKNGIPVSAGTLAIDKMISPQKLQTLSNIVLEGGVFHIHASGGCAVVVIDFKPENIAVAKRAGSLCDEWFRDINNPNGDNHYLTLTIVPLLLSGSLYIVYNQLVFKEFRETETGSRLILAFDNTATTPVVTDIDVKALELEVYDELRKEEEDLLESIAKGEKELEKLQKKESNPYLETVEQVLDVEADSEDVIGKNKNVRFTKEDNDV